MSSNEDIHKVIDIIGHHRICMMTAVGADNVLQSWPMTVMKVEDDGELWFFSSIGSGPVEEVGTESQVNLSFTGKNDWLSVHGFAAIITSEPKAREMWNEAAAAFYPDGPESKNLVLIRVRRGGTILGIARRSHLHRFPVGQGPTNRRRDRRRREPNAQSLTTIFYPH
ncbi:pyridoxamine 5'-phosphate oxidase family protein [Arthrobacter alpinus]|nr:pyridoxamine 5'-phosphate oxidase family protein [Arthrobacter alpinus]